MTPQDLCSLLQECCRLLGVCADSVPVDHSFRYEGTEVACKLGNHDGEPRVFVTVGRLRATHAEEACKTMLAANLDLATSGIAGFFSLHLEEMIVLLVIPVATHPRPLPQDLASTVARSVAAIPAWRQSVFQGAIEEVCA